MNTKKKLFKFIFSLVIVLSIIPIVKVQAATKDVDIISKSEVTVKEARDWAESKGATKTFMDLAELYFDYSSDCGDVNPAIAYVQAAKETAYGNFGGVIDESYCNPCGLKTEQGGDNYDPNAHQRFDSWEEGVQAHLDHLALYAGADRYPKKDSHDPRNFKTIKGKATTVNSLGGNWAPSATYGKEVNALYKDLLVYAGVEEADKDDNKDHNNGDVNKNESSNSTTSPGIQENKPSALNISEVIANSNNTQTNIESNIGWKNENGVWCYYKSDNTKATGWIKPGAEWYYLKDDGRMSTGWINYSGTWYYFKSSGEMAKGWLKDGASWYYFQGDGSMVTGLKKIDGKNYLLNDNGSMNTGWSKINNYWYYFNTDGSMSTGWLNYGNTTYYLYDTGAMAKGWINISGAWYYSKDNGEIAKGWINVGSDYYYLDITTGRMFTNTIVDGYSLGTNGKRQASTSKDDTSNNKNTSKEKKTIVVDAGHNYGGDRGAQPIIDGVTYEETDLNIEVACKLQKELEEKGFNVIMTREEDEKEKLPEIPSLKKRVNIANNSDADFFISIHHNSASVEEAKGVETYYSSKAQDEEFGGKLDSSRIAKSKKLASEINNKLAERLQLKNRGAKDSALKVCMNTTMPAILVEVGFITNKEEAERCSDPKSQQIVSETIAEVIAENF